MATRDDDLILCRSDRGDGGWSLHAPGATDEEIACGDAPAILTGEALWEDGRWSRPNQTDYTRAWLLAHENDESLDPETLRAHVIAFLGREPTAEDWDRIPEMLKGE